MSDIDPRLQKLTKMELLELVNIVSRNQKLTEKQIAVAKALAALRNGKLIMDKAASEAKGLEKKKGKKAMLKLCRAYLSFKRGEAIYLRAHDQWQKIESKQAIGSKLKS